MHVFTARFGNRGLRERPDLVKVRASIGSPRFNPGFAIEDDLPVIMPWGLLKVTDEEDFCRRYIAGLENVGVERIRRELQAVSNRHEGRDLVLLCYENVWEGKLCHRRVFAEWYEEQTGEVIDEIEEPRTPALF